MNTCPTLRRGWSRCFCLGMATVVTLTLTFNVLHGGTCTPPASGLAGWWPAEANANDIIGGDNGTLQGGAGYSPGKVGLGFRLDGTNSYVQIPDSAALKPTNVTVEAWVWLDPALPSQSGNEQIVFKKNTWTAWFEGYSLLKGTIDNGNGTYSDRFQFCVSRYGSQVAINSQTIAQRGVWYHVAATYDGNQSKLYVNGVLEASATPGFPLDYDITPIFIGTTGTWAPYLNMFGGIIDEASIYNRALATSEIAAIYNAGSAGKCLITPPGCQIYSNFNSTVGLSLVGSATVTNGVLRLTPAVVGQTGDAWLSSKQPCAGGFDTTFHFAISQLGNDLGNEPGGDGFTFAVQNLGPTNNSWAMGDTNQFVGVFFNTFWNWPGCTCPDVSDNSVGIVVNQTYIAQTDLNPLGINMSDGATHLARVSFDGAGFTVWVDGAMVLTNVTLPGLAPGVDATGQGWVGFSAGTGGAFENHDIVDWSFCLDGNSFPRAGVPTISNFSPAVGTNGTVVAILGNNFSPNTTGNIVYFGAVRAVVLAASPTNLLVVVPAGATYSPITVAVSGMVAFSAAPFEPTFTGNGAAIDTSTLAARLTLPTPAGPYRTAIADLDGDGRPDVIVAGGTAGAISIFQNLGTNGLINAGTFAAPVTIPVGNNGSAAGLAVADVNGDGKLDLVVSDNINNRIVIFQNQSSVGTLTANSFAAPVALTVGTDPRKVLVNDMDGDGFPDLICVNAGSGTVSIFRNLGVPGWLTGSSYASRLDLMLAGSSESVSVGDLDGDGRPDLAVADHNGFVSLFQNFCTPGNLGAGNFGPRVDLPAQSDSVEVVIGDLDGDGKPELIASAYLTSVPSTMSVYRNLSTPGTLTVNSFAAPVDYSLAGRGHNVALADFDGDGKPDIAEVTELASALSLFQNVGTGSFTNTSLGARVDFATGWNAWGLAVGDLDGDGRPDVVFANSYDNTITIYQNQAPFGLAPVITLQPTNLTAAVGSTAIFSVAAQGSAPLSFQWSFNSTNLPGATNISLTLPNVQLAQAGNYSVVISNPLGSVASSNVSLTVFVPMIPPTIISQTPNQVVLLGSTATFSVGVTGSDPLSYFWRRNGVLIPDATNSSYSLPNAQLADSGSKFSCLVTNAYGSASSTNASLKVIDTIANDLCSGAIYIPNLPNTSYTNTQSTLKASSFGDPTPDCVDGFGHGVWYEFTPVVGGLLIVDTFGSDFDTGLAVYVGPCDQLTEVACNDDTAGVTSQVTIPTTGGITYYILAGGYGSDAGNLVLHLNHLTPPSFVVQPSNQLAVAGSNAVFAVQMSGTQPLGYQWLLDGNPLSDNTHYAGSTSSALTISNVTTADAIGNYTVTVTNFLGSVTSVVANLSVLSVTTQPVGRSVPVGLPTTFTAVASTYPPPAYQWQLNGTNIPGATSATYTIPAVGTNDLGFYHLLAIYPVGVAVSSDAQLTFGPVAAWGLNSSGECLPPPGLSQVFGVAGTPGASFALRSDGSIAAWGGGIATNVPHAASNVVALAASGGPAIYALRSDGTVCDWNGITVPGQSNLVSISAGNNFALGLRAEGTVAGWGTPPVPVPGGLNRITAIACGYTHSLALRSDGTVVAWGSVSAGPAINVPAGLANVIAIAAGYSHSLALKSDGTVVAWGAGAGTNLPAGMTNIVAISADNSAGSNFGLAIRADGRVLTWGDSVSGQINPPSGLNSLVSIAGAAARYHGLALVSDGSPVIVRPPVGLTAYTGRDVTLQAAAVGAAPLSYQWLLNGTNIPGATGTSLVISNIQSANAGYYQLFVSNNVNTALSLPAPLTVVSNYLLGFLSQPSGTQTNYQGGKSVLGVTVFGSGPLHYQWSSSTNNQFFVPVAGATNDSLVFNPAMAIQSGYYRVTVSNQFTSATSLSTYLRVLFAKAWGYQPKDPPFDATNAIAIAVGNVQQGSALGHYLVLKSDGKLSSWSGGFAQYGETNVAALSNSFVTAIAAGYQDSLALKSDSTVYAWGFGVYGQTNVPPGLNGVTAIACGDYHDLALKPDGTIVGWGQTTYQQTTNSAATNVVAIAAGGQNSMVLRADGTVTSWGFYGGNYPVPPSATNVIAIAAGGQHYLALRANGTVVGWGNNSFGQTTIPANISNVVAVSAGATHSVLLRNDGTVVTLGTYNSQIPASTYTPGDLANVIAIASSGDHDLALFGTRVPVITVQPWNRAFPVGAITNITLAAKCAGVQPVRYQWQLNGTNVPGATNDTLLLRNDPKLGGPIQTGAYQLIASNVFGVAFSKYAKITTFIPLADALDTPKDGRGNPIYNWTSSGSAPWYGETNITHDGVDAAQSGGIGALQETILQTTVATNWSGRYTFWWKVSSEQDFDFLEFRVNGITQASISGQVDWQLASIPVAAFTNVLQWRYSKDPSFDFGLDAGWVDQFAFVPDPPMITLQPVSQTVFMGTNVTLRVVAVGPTALGGGPTLRYIWNQNGVPVGGNSPFLVLNNVGRAQNGSYSVIVTNFAIPNNSILSSNALLKVLVPQLLGMPVLLPDGSLQLTSADANGGLLQPSDLTHFEAQTSTNLLDWVTLPNALGFTNGMLLLTDTTQTNDPARFYRLIEH